MMFNCVYRFQLCLWQLTSNGWLPSEKRQKAMRIGAIEFSRKPTQNWLYSRQEREPKAEIFANVTFKLKKHKYYYITEPHHIVQYPRKTGD